MMASSPERGRDELRGIAAEQAELRRVAAEQAALRRVAMLVAGGAAAEEVFAAVAAEAGRVLQANLVWIARYEPDGAATVLAAWASSGAAVAGPAGTRVRGGGRNVGTLVFETGRAARIDDYAGASGPAADTARESGVRSAVGVPVSVEGQLWGVLDVASTQELLPAGTEERLAGFTEVAGIAMANAQARMELRAFAEEQAALRRVATLVAGGTPPEQVFAAVAAEAGRLADADSTVMSRYNPDGGATIVGTWTRTGAALPVPVGFQFGPGGRNTASLVFRTGRAARVDDYARATGPTAEPARQFGIRAAAGVPITVDGYLWGVMTVGSTQGPLPASTEVRLAAFTELAATAIANAEAHAALAASRARIVATADQTRRRIERDLHDGAQQRLVTLALEVRAAQAAPPEGGELVQWLDAVATGLSGVMEELREIARGLHPAILAERGLGPALKALARRSAVPVTLDVRVIERLPEPAEIAAYYMVAEALTNTSKHARASAVEVQVELGEGVLHVRVHDDGRGGADFARGSGLVGLKDRAEALGGRLSLHSAPGAGTKLQAELPLTTAVGGTVH
jgi:signal transduction histidine kinase